MQINSFQTKTEKCAILPILTKLSPEETVTHMLCESTKNCVFVCCCLVVVLWVTWVKTSWPLRNRCFGGLTPDWGILKFGTLGVGSKLFTPHEGAGSWGSLCMTFCHGGIYVKCLNLSFLFQCKYLLTCPVCKSHCPSVSFWVFFIDNCSIWIWKLWIYGGEEFRFHLYQHLVWLSKEK